MHGLLNKAGFNKQYIRFINNVVYLTIPLVCVLDVTNIMFKCGLANSCFCMASVILVITSSFFVCNIEKLEGPVDKAKLSA